MRIGRRSGATSEMSFSSISDIAFLLIIFFMVASSFIVSEGFHLVLPDRSQKPVITPRSEVLILSVKKDGKLTSEGKELSLAEAPSFLEKALAAKKKAVILKTASASPYGRIVRVIELVKGAGFTSLSLRMDK